MNKYGCFIASMAVLSWSLFAAAPAVAAPAAKPAPHDAAFYTDLEQRLQFLKRLRDQNLIGPEEFERKQRELLKDL